MKTNKFYMKYISIAHYSSSVFMIAVQWYYSLLSAHIYALMNIFYQQFKRRQPTVNGNSNGSSLLASPFFFSGPRFPLISFIVDEFSLPNLTLRGTQAYEHKLTSA